MTNIDTLLFVTEMKGTRISGGGGGHLMPSWKKKKECKFCSLNKHSFKNKQCNNNRLVYFDVLLTVHLSIILVINQLDAQNLAL